MGTLIDILKYIDENPPDILKKIKKTVEKESKRKEVLKTLNPKIIDYKYEF